MRAAAVRAVVTAVGLIGAVSAGPAFAQSAEEFYRGRSIDMIVGYPPGGSNDLYARIVARHLGGHIVGNPTIVLRNMPGAGSIVAGNYIFNIAARDGTVLGIISPTSPLDEKLGAVGVKFESAKFTWIGRATSTTHVSFFSRNGPIQTARDMFEKESKMSATGAGSTVVIYPSVMNNVLGTKFNLVMGYRGSGEAMLALARGEVDGHSTSLDALNAEHPDWVSGGDVRILVQYGAVRHPTMPDVPTCYELAITEEQRQILRAVMSSVEVGKMFFSTPGVPPERTEALRRAFDAMTQDPAFVADVQKSRMDLIPMRGEDLAKLVGEVATIDPDLLAKVKKIYPQGG